VAWFDTWHGYQINCPRRDNNYLNTADGSLSEKYSNSSLTMIHTVGICVKQRRGIRGEAGGADRCTLVLSLEDRRKAFCLGIANIELQVYNATFC
jgi:hypothetical protein